MSKHSYTQKLTRSASLVSMASMSFGAADAAIVTVSDRPVSAELFEGRFVTYAATFGIPVGNAWDVDGVGNAEFNLIRRERGNYTDTVRTQSNGFGTVFLASVSAYGNRRDSYNGRGFVGEYPLAPIKILPAGFQVGATLADYTFVSQNAPSPYSSHVGQPGLIANFSRRRFTNGYGGIVYGYTVYTILGYLGGQIENAQIGENFIGFRFESSEGLHFGWATINIEFGLGGHQRITISDWTYNTTAGKPVAVGQVSEPESSLPALTLLALGAAGVRSWRKHRKSEPVILQPAVATV